MPKTITELFREAFGKGVGLDALAARLQEMEDNQKAKPAPTLTPKKK